MLEFAHAGFYVVFDLEAIGLQVGDPFFAATTIGVAMNLDRNEVGGLDQGRHEQGAQGDQTQRVSHGIRLG
ncbi:hypothetical protein D9M71_451450 [compost metagenome]